MPQETGTVTEVGAGQIQFYIPSEVSSSDDCPFNPRDEFRVRTIADVGLLITPVDVRPTVADLIDGLDIPTRDEPRADQPLHPETTD